MPGPSLFKAVAAILLLSPCAGAAEADALAISQNIQARHLPFGTVLDPINSAPGSNQIVGYTRCGDSALWTGAYLAAEAFRYNVTPSADVLNNLTQALDGLKSLVDVTGTDLLARCRVPVDSPFEAGIASEEAANGIYSNTPGFIWVGNTTRDEYTGVVFGLAVTYDLVNDPAIQSSASALLTRLLRFLIASGWDIVMPDGSSTNTFLIRPDQILTFLQVGRHVNPTQFATEYSKQKPLLAGSAFLPVSIDVLSDGSYFKFNLDYLNFYSLIHLDPDSTNVYLQDYQIVRNHTASHQNALFNVIDRALTGANPGRDAATLTMLDQWLLRPRRDPPVDLTSTVPVCGSQACQPIPIPLRVPTDFLWQRSPFQLAGGGSGIVESAGIDYILPYWMARYYSLQPAFFVQPAAAPGSAVAPESLASLYGAGVASQTASASEQPLPTSLGGVTLAVTDAAGTQRSAPLVYVSPTQINFEVPAGTTSGTATYTLNNGAATLTATGNVLNVAPTLFSASGTGIGVAAATAVATQVNDPQAQTPVQVFQCSEFFCSATPINLGLDTPVYLSLYGTGIRNRSSLSNVQVSINGINVPALYAGPQGAYAGLDQVNVPLFLNLRGSGVDNVVLTVDGQVSNTVTIAVQ